MTRTLKRTPPAWIRVAGTEDAGDLVEFYMTPASSLQFDMALERATRASRQLADSGEIRGQYGLDELGSADMAEDVDTSLGVSTTIMATELALIVATDFRGYLNEAGDGPAEFNRRSVALAMQDWHGAQSLAQHFMGLALAPIYRVKSEGKP